MSIARRVAEIEQQLGGVPLCSTCGWPLRDEDRKAIPLRFVRVADDVELRTPDRCPECGVMLTFRITIDRASERAELPND